MRRILMWCSPGFGMVDVWLPVIRQLKEQDDLIVDFVFPEPSTLRLEEEYSTLFQLAEKFSDRVIYRTYSKRWFTASTLIEAKSNIKFSRLDEKILLYARKFTKGKLSNIIFLKFVGRMLSLISKYSLTLRENLSSYSSYDIKLLSKVDAILCDITIESKIVNGELKKNLRNIKKFSMLHGLDPVWVQPEFNCVKKTDKRSDVFVYSISPYAVKGYENCYGILRSNIMHVGLPRHDDDWIKYIKNFNQLNIDEKYGKFVLLIGRPAGPFNPPERKKKALRDIYNLICIKNKLKLIVKTHPKEDLAGYDGRMYKEVLGMDNYGKSWSFSAIHPLIIGKDAFFSISFYSGVALDMLALNKPTIEYLDMRNLNSYKGNDVLFDKNGNKVLQYRFSELVIGVDSNLALNVAVESIINNYDEALFPLKSKYLEYFEPVNNVSKKIADDIFLRINKITTFDS